MGGEGQQKFNDTLDFVIQASQIYSDIKQEDGTFRKEVIIDPEIVWWKSLLVNKDTFGRFAWELKEFERQASTCVNHMNIKRATDFAQEILEIGQSYRRSIDAKGSESQLNKTNSQSTYIDKINRNKIEKVYTTKGQVKNSLVDSFLGRDKEKDMEDD